MNLIFFRHKIYLTVIGGACKSGTDEVTSSWNEIFEHWVRKLVRKFRVNERKIALILENGTAHSSISILANMQLFLLPPTTTSVLHAMEEDVIRSLKAHYSGRVVHLLCRALKKNEPKAFSFTSNEDTC